LLIVPPLHPWVKSGAVKVSDLKSETMIFREQGSGTRRTIERKLAEQGITVEQIPQGIELGSSRAVITAVEAGLGVSIVSKYAVRESLELERVKKVHIDDFDLSRTLYQVRHNQSMAGFAIDAFTDFINNDEVCEVIGFKKTP